MTQDEFDRYVLPSYKRFPITIARGDGSYIYDDQGKKYLDFMSAWGVSNLGHRPKPVVEAIVSQSEKLIHAPNVFYFEPQGRLAKLLVENSIEGKVFFSNSGAEANEAAIKFAKLYGKGRRGTIITTERSFHGRTAATMAATGQDKVREGFAPHLPGFKHVPFNDVEALRAAVDDDTLAIMLEIVQGEGGIHIATTEYAEALKEICSENDILLIVDEVQSGMGRTGTFLAYQSYGLRPDIITCAKALASGLPMGATIVGGRVAELVKPGMHGSTFGGGALVAEAALATVKEILEQKTQDNAAKLADLLSMALAGLEDTHACIKQVRQKGLMIGMELDRETGPIAEACLEKGLYVNSTQGTTLRLLPPLTATSEEADTAISIIDEVLTESGRS